MLLLLALPEVISTTNGTAYLHLPGLIMPQNAQGQRVYLLPDGLGSVRQVVSGTSVIAWRDYDPYGQVRASDPFTHTFDTSLEGWAFDSAWDIPAVLSNPPGVMRLAATQSAPTGHYNTITVKKLLNGGMGALTVSTVFTTYSGTTVQFWVAYADGSTETIYSYGTTPSTPYRHVANYTTQPGKTPVALYFYAAASWLFPPFQVDIDTISAVPAASSPLVPTGLGPTPYAFTGEWWEQDVKLLHLRARWYDGSSGVFVSKDVWEGNYQKPQTLNGWNYVEGNPVNLTDPTGLAPNCQNSTCKIELLSGEAGGQAISAHFSILFTDRKDNSTNIQAWPLFLNGSFAQVPWADRLAAGNFKDVGNPVYWNPIHHPYYTDAGRLGAVINNLTLKEVKALKNKPTIRVAIVVDGEEFCDKLECLKNAMRQIERNEIGYMLLGPNSNSAAISILRKCNLPWFGPVWDVAYQAPNRFAPGYLLYLLSESANGRAYRKPLEGELVQIPPLQYYPGQ